MTKLVSFTVDPDKPRRLTPEQEAELARFAEMDDDSIDFSDIPETDFSNAILFRDRHRTKPAQKSATVRIDADVLHWLKAKGKGYQARLNAILREAMLREVR